MGNLEFAMEFHQQFRLRAAKCVFQCSVKLHSLRPFQRHKILAETVP
jgi:hypothetical protein